jgi:hypothetical protein
MERNVSVCSEEMRRVTNANERGRVYSVRVCKSGAGRRPRVWGNGHACAVGRAVGHRDRQSRRGVANLSECRYVAVPPVTHNSSTSVAYTFHTV